jgi:hypothetical protein
MEKQQPETPWLHAVETARRFAPDYDTELTEWDLNPADWQHVCPCRFGPSRRSSWSPNTRWSGDSYRYDLYQRDIGGTTKYALRWQNGAGCGWLICENRALRDETSLIEMIAVMPDEARRWDAAHFLWEATCKTALAAALQEHRRMARAFVDRRLKKRKVRGREAYRVNILPSLADKTAAFIHELHHPSTQNIN